MVSFSCSLSFLFIFFSLISTNPWLSVTPPKSFQNECLRRGIKEINLQVVRDNQIFTYLSKLSAYTRPMKNV